MNHNKKIVKEVAVYLFDHLCVDAGWVSERMYFAYRAEIRQCLDYIDIGDDFRKGHAEKLTAQERHLKRLKRLLDMVDFIYSLVIDENFIRNVSVEEWNRRYDGISARTRQRDLKVLKKAGYRIEQKNGRYFFEIDADYYCLEE